MSADQANEGTVEEALASLHAALDANEDAIGQAGITWRRVAANPAGVAAAVEKLAGLERQRELLLKAVAEAEQALADKEAEGRAVRRVEEAGQLMADLEPMLTARVITGRQLDQAVQLVADLIAALNRQGLEISRAWNPAAAQLTGVTGQQVSLSINAEDLHGIVNQMLAERLGRLWPEPVSQASMGVTAEARMTREVSFPLVNLRRAAGKAASAAAEGGPSHLGLMST